MNETTEKNISGKTGFSFCGFLSQQNLSLILGRASIPMKISTVMFRKYGHVVQDYKNENWNRMVKLPRNQSEERLHGCETSDVSRNQAPRHDSSNGSTKRPNKRRG